MKLKQSILFLLGSLTFLMIGCTEAQSTQKVIQKPEKTATASRANTLTDSTLTDARDGETYAIVKIGAQIWMAENLRFKMEGAMLNPENPSKSYGRLYKLMAAQIACPNGWHLPSDAEWDELEIAHGMPESFIGKGGWRGEHAVNLKSTTSWEDDGNGTNSLGFNVLPAGYYFSGVMGIENAGMQGLGYSAAFWSAREINIGFARFMFSPRKFVNKWEDKNNDSEAALSCRCVKN